MVIAEDDAVAREALTTLLREEGHQVTAAGDGREALALVLATAPEVVVTDHLMPALDGLSLIRQAREAGSHSFFVLVCGVPPDDAHAQADLVLGKPLRIELLFDALDRLARAPRGEA